jgi:hypothetical protein
VRRILALLMGAVLVGSGAAAAAQQDYVDAEPAPVGQAVSLDPGQVTVTVLGVTVVDEATSLLTGLDEADQAPDRAGVVVELEITNAGSEPFDLGRGFWLRLIDASGRGWGSPNSISTCGERDTTWVWYGLLRPGRTAVTNVCFAVPGDQLDGAFIEIAWREGGAFYPFSLDMTTAATPVASPAAR